VHGLHLNFAMTTQNRERIRAQHEHTKSMDVSQLGSLDAGFFDFGNGHVVLWGDWPNRGDRRPNFHMYDEWTERFGQVYAEWMIGKLRNTLIYPNVFLMDQMSSQIRVFRPLAVDKTEVTPSRPRASRRRCAPTAFASTRTSSTPPAWPLRTT
jgi:benzoate/toluate 1,2-dioxygenase alpha subunit